MPDVWAAFTELDAAMQERLAGVLETRGADPQQRAMRRAFLADITFPPNARVLEVGCGTGVLTRTLARWPDVDAVVGVDVAPSLLRKGRDLAVDLPNITFHEADARSLPFEDETFDVVVFDSTLPTCPAPKALSPRRSGCCARPVGWRPSMATTRRPRSRWATTTRCKHAWTPCWTTPCTTAGSGVACPRSSRGCGFDIKRFRSHGFVERAGGYMPTIVERGVDILLASGQIGDGTAEALKAETRRRVEAGTFFGHIAYVSIIARKPS